LPTKQTKADSTRLSDAIKQVRSIRNQYAIPQKGGKKYLQVQDRLEVFRNVFDLDFAIHTHLVEATNNTVVIKAEIVRVEDNAILATGYAEENRNQGYVNKTSAVENGETSAIGRALANLGMHGGEYATINEIVNANEDRETGNTTAAARKADHKFETANAYLNSMIEQINGEEDRDALEGYWKTTVDKLTTGKRLEYFSSNKKLKEKWAEVNTAYVTKIETLMN
tara:strand:+ start:1725 stop:2399 length:675 start_codon:yes stop_codon:yes gene_type:complete